jgi:hypothetical protein
MFLKVRKRKWRDLNIPSPKLTEELNITPAEIQDLTTLSKDIISMYKILI